LPIQISLTNAQRDLPLCLPEIRQVVALLLNELKICTDEVIFHFVSDRKMRLIHNDFFNDPSSTDCITFPLDPPKTKAKVHHILGEAFVCPKTALLYAEKHGINPYEELYRYIAHCLLHMIGYSDTEATQRAKMKRKERHCLKRLAAAGLVPQNCFDTKKLCSSIK